jgi:DNA-binding transcriptional LysR family regulator
MIPSPSELTYFLEVSTSLNFSRASERLGISQPSLSLAIQKLEHSLGVPLFFRSKKGVTLTQAGKQLLLHVRPLLQSWESIRNQTLASVDEVQGSYRIGCHPSVGLYSLGSFLPDLLEEYPKLEVTLVHDLSRKIAERVIQMEVDIGIVVNPVRHPDLVIHKLCDDEVGLWTGISRRQIQNYQNGEGVLICDLELIQVQSLLKDFKKKGFYFKRVINSSSLEVITHLAHSGAGTAILPSRVATSHPSFNLRPVRGSPIFKDEISLLYRVENKQVRSIRAICERIENSFTKKVPASLKPNSKENRYTNHTLPI